MRDYVTIGCVPYEENCVQVGHPDFPQISRIECNVFADMIRRIFDEKQDALTGQGISIIAKSFAHDFGTYREVVVYYNDDEDDAIDLAFEIEDANIAHWDDLARRKLASDLSAIGVTMKRYEEVINRELTKC